MGKRGRKPGVNKQDGKTKLEKSRVSARECRVRKKLRYEYLEELVSDREKAIYSLQDELQVYKTICEQIDNGVITEEVKKFLENE
jgi:DNA-binding transcriptional regulator GbsR (MarR family)